MTAEMNTAFSLNTLEGMTLGSAYAAALLEDQPPTCSDEELEESVVFPSLLIVVEFKLEFLLQVRSTNL